MHVTENLYFVLDLYQQHLWFLLGIVAKSMSQYLSIIGKDSVSNSTIVLMCSYSVYAASFHRPLQERIDSWRTLAGTSRAWCLPYCLY